MTTRYEKPSGIVLYPEDKPLMYGEANDPEGQLQLGPDPIGANIARQLGFVTNAYMDDEGNVTPGTAHAVGYDPAIARAITDIYYPGNGKHLLHPRDSDKAEVKELSDMLLQNMYEYLADRNLAVEGIARTLAYRRIDIIAPAGRGDGALRDGGRALASAVSYIRPRYGGESDSDTAGNLWLQKKRGVLVERRIVDDMGPNLDYRHPVQRAKRDIKGSMSNHEIRTSLDTLLPQVHEGFTMTEYNSLNNILRATPGFSLQAGAEKIETYHTAVYDLPVDDHTHSTIADISLRILEQNDADDAELAKLHNEEKTYDQQMDPHAAGDMMKRREQKPVAGSIDPLEDFEWRSRLS